MSAEKLPPDRRPPASAADAAARLATIVDAAERAAASVIDDAEAQAQRHIDTAGERADRIVAERLRELADELDPPGGAERRGGHLKPVAPVELATDAVRRAEEPAEEGEERSEPSRSGSAGARLLATQMAVSGAGRAEIEARLRDGFEIEDTSEILDAILGPEGD
jgi:hypothetical protein